MIFFYHPLAGESEIEIVDDFYNSLVRARRKKKGQEIRIQNCTDNVSYTYRIETIEKKKAILRQISQKEIPSFSRNLHIGWGICDAKTIYSTLPILNQLGVSRITFVECARSQGNISVSNTKIEKILIGSCEQSGRNDIMKYETKSFTEFLQENSTTLICDFNGKNFSSQDYNRSSDTSYSSENIFLIGPEGGFTEEERNTFPTENIRTFPIPFVLKSETTCISIASSFATDQS